jgi:excinuclease UvrABC helicase subunit UvrB
MAQELEREELAKSIEAEMKAAAERLDYQTAALLRDELFELRGEMQGKSRRPKTLRERIGLESKG